MDTAKTRSKESVIQQVVKLLSLADESRNPSQNEVLNALTAAKRLMAEYEIDEAEVRESRGDKAPAWTFTHDVGIGGRAQLFQWEYTLSVAVEKLTGTKAVVHRKTRRAGRSVQAARVEIRYYGEEVDVAIACALYGCLRDSARKMAEAAWKSWSDRRSYLEGFMSAIYDRASRPAEVAPEQRNAYALVSTKKKDWLAARVQETLPNLRSQKGEYMGIRNSGAYGHGVRDGRNADLNPAGKLTQ